MLRSKTPVSCTGMGDTIKAHTRGILQSEQEKMTIGISYLFLFTFYNTASSLKLFNSWFHLNYIMAMSSI